MWPTATPALGSQLCRPSLIWGAWRALSRPTESFRTAGGNCRSLPLQDQLAPSPTGKRQDPVLWWTRLPLVAWVQGSLPSLPRTLPELLTPGEGQQEHLGRWLLFGSLACEAPAPGQASLIHPSSKAGEGAGQRLGLMRDSLTFMGPPHPSPPQPPLSCHRLCFSSGVTPVGGEVSRIPHCPACVWPVLTKATWP